MKLGMELELTNFLQNCIILWVKNNFERHMNNDTCLICNKELTSKEKLYKFPSHSWYSSPSLTDKLGSHKHTWTLSDNCYNIYTQESGILSETCCTADGCYQLLNRLNRWQFSLLWYCLCVLLRPQKQHITQASLSSSSFISIKAEHTIRYIKHAFIHAKIR